MLKWPLEVTPTANFTGEESIPQKMKRPALLQPGSSKTLNVSPDTLPESEKDSTSYPPRICNQVRKKKGTRTLKILLILGRLAQLPTYKGLSPASGWKPTLSDVLSQRPGEETGPLKAITTRHPPGTQQ